MNVAVAKLERQAEEAEAQATRLRKMAEFVKELGEHGLAELIELVAVEPNGNGSTNGNHNGNGHAQEKGPRGREAVRRIVSSRPGIWTLTELREAMQAEGWFTTSKGLEVAVKRLTTAGECRRVGKGRYEFPEKGEEGVDDESLRADPSGNGFTM